MTDNNLAAELDRFYENICNRDFIILDPVQFPRMFSRREDIEIAAFLSATIAWGRRDLILRSAKKMFASLGPSPYDYVMEGGYKNLKDKNIHRTFFEHDLKYFCRGFRQCYVKYGNLENLFAQSPSCVWKGFYTLREEMASANKGLYSKHLADSGADNESGSACKRLNLALRWLVRKGPVDLNLWKKIKSDSLYIPLDVHVARTARGIGLLHRKSNDKKAVIELTEKLRVFCPQDPVKYDFALFGIGAQLGTRKRADE
ncbi:MAG: TIGR02757 family protein [Treponema sp.]|nr:TIGR02757 family protein [Treponema sp.]